MAITRLKTTSHEDWLKLRHKYIGGSDAAAVVGLNPWVSRYSLWAEKTGRLPSFQGNLATEVGTYLEEFVAKKYEHETGKKVRRVNQSILNSDFPFAIANIDREIVGEDAGLEIKTTSELNLKKFKGGEYPALYYCQCVHYMAITGKKRWYLAVLIGNREFKWFVIERDESEIDALMETESEFYEYIKNNTPPPVDGSQATTNAIKAIYTDSDDGYSVEIYDKTDLEQYIQLSNKIKELEKIRDEHTNKIKLYMEEAEMAESEKYTVFWKSSIRRTFDIKRFISEHPEIDFTEYYKDANTRTFRVLEKKGV